MKLIKNPCKQGLVGNVGITKKTFSGQTIQRGLVCQASLLVAAFCEMGEKIVAPDTRGYDLDFVPWIVPLDFGVRRE